MVHTADNVENKNVSLQGTTVCTFVNSRQASVVVDKIWKINGVDYGPASGVVSGLGLTAQLKIAGTNQAWGVARTGFLAGESTSFTEEASSSNSLCTIDSQLVTLDHGNPVIPANGALPYSTGALLGGSNGYTITNTVTCVAQVTLLKVVQNGPALASAWTLSANDGGSGADLSGPTGTSGSIKADTVYTLSEDNADPRYDQVGPWTCTNGVTVTAGTINVGKGVSTTCTVTNATAKLTLIKQVVNDSGGTLSASSWTLGFTPSGGATTTSGPGAESPGTSYWVNPGTAYTVSESGPNTYAASVNCGAGNVNGTSTQVTPAANTEVTCTFTNNDKPGHLTLIKIVDNGDTQSGYDESDFTLSANGPTPISGLTGEAVITNATVNAGSYTLSEDGPAGYDDGDGWSCTGGTLTGDSVLVGLNADVTCTITNTAIAPTLTLIKYVDNGTSGLETLPEAWTLQASGPEVFSGPGGFAASPVPVGTYALSEFNGPDGYDAEAWICSKDMVDATHVELVLAENVVCSIRNVADETHLTLVKNVVNGQSGGSAVATDFTLTATGPSTFGGAGGASEVVEVGSYDLSETTQPGYTASAWSCSGAGGTQDDADTVSLALGANVTCTITNTAIAPKLTIDKVVVNGDTGSTLTKTSWTLERRRSRGPRRSERARHGHGPGRQLRPVGGRP